MLVVLIVVAGFLAVVVVAVIAVSRVSVELEGTMAPALLEIDDAIEVVSEALPFEVAAVVSHDDVDEVLSWVLEWFDQLGVVSDFGEEMGGDWVVEGSVIIDEIGAADYAVARGIENRPDLESVHVTVIVDAFINYMRDIGAVGDEV